MKTWVYVSALLAASGCARGASGIEPGGMDSGMGMVEDAAADDAGDATDDAGGEPMDGGNDSGASSDAGGTEDSGTEDAGPVCAMAVNTCQTARSISNVAGDDGSDVSATSGNASEWVQLEIRDVGNVFNADSTIKADITLNSPDGSNYDLFVYQPTPSGGKATAPKDCGVVPKSSQKTVGDDTVSLSWSDQQNILGESAGDGLVVSIEVRYISGTCGQWTLTVNGNP